MPCTDAVIIGAGHAGLARSRCLTDRGVRHVVLDRGQVGERWRTARWDSFRLLAPSARLYAIGLRFQYRRNSTSSTASATTPNTSPTTSSPTVRGVWARLEWTGSNGTVGNTGALGAPAPERTVAGGGVRQ